MCPVFDLRLLLPGLALLLPDRADPSRASRLVELPKLMRTFAESARWNEILGISNVADLNEMIEKRTLREFIRVNEELHEISLVNIAQKFLASGARLILVAGPSSSGKTTMTPPALHPAAGHGAFAHENFAGRLLSRPRRHPPWTKTASATWKTRTRWI